MVKKKKDYTKIQKMKAAALRILVCGSSSASQWQCWYLLIGYILIKGVPCLKPKSVCMEIQYG